MFFCLSVTNIGKPVTIKSFSRSNYQKHTETDNAKSVDIYPFRHGKMNKVSLSGFPTATTIPYTTRQSEVCALKRIYRFLIGMYATSSNTFLYAGRIMRLPSKFNSSLRCAHQPTIRAMANSGVNISCGNPIISYTKPE